MDRKGTEQQRRKMPRSSPVVLVLIALTALVGSSQGDDGRVCYYGQERDPNSNGKLRWIMPSEDHQNRCSCTRIKIGGVNPTGKRRTDGAIFTDKPLFTRDTEKIRDYFNCNALDLTTVENSATEPPASTDFSLPTTTTETPTATTVTEPLATTTDPSAATTDHQNTPIAGTTSSLNTPTQTGALPTTTTEPPTTTTTAGPADCQALLDAGHTTSGVYSITPAQYPAGLEVYCNMTTDSKGWIVFQRRVDGSVNFIRSWAEYRDGFGDKEGEFWLGNEILRRLTEPVDGEQGWQMRVELLGDEQQDGMYDDFHVDGNNYTLHVGAFTSPISDLALGDQLSPSNSQGVIEYPSNGQPFSTYDRDNDADTSRNCAEEMKGGWWFNQCTVMDDFDEAARHSNLNGEYSQTPDWQVYGNGIVWTNAKGQITHSEMKMRRKI